MLSNLKCGLEKYEAAEDSHSEFVFFSPSVFLEERFTLSDQVISRGIDQG